MTRYKTSFEWSNGDERNASANSLCRKISAGTEGMFACRARVRSNG